MSAVLGRRFDTLDTARIMVADGRIAGIEPVVDYPADADCALPWIAPGFVDLQINGYGGQEFSSATLTAEHVGTIGRGQEMFSIGSLIARYNGSSSSLGGRRGRIAPRQLCASRQLLFRRRRLASAATSTIPSAGNISVEGSGMGLARSSTKSETGLAPTMSP